MPKNEDDEARLFRLAVGPVRPVDCDWIVPSKPAPRVTVPRDRHPEPDPWAAPAECPPDPRIGPHTPLAFAREGVQNSVLRRLRRGQYSVDGELDLHGMTREQAKTALARFLRHMEVRGARCVRIVHGKGVSSPGGQPVLKQHLDGWLRQSRQVIAFSSARPRDGGTGAVYVLLRR